MALDKIPTVDWGVLDTYKHDRHSSPEEFERFKSEIQEHLERNRALGAVIRVIAQDSNDPNSVYHAAYTVLDMINSQLEVNELNSQARLKYRGKVK